MNYYKIEYNEEHRPKMKIGIPLRTLVYMGVSKKSLNEY